MVARRGRMGRDVPAITVSQQDRRRYREKVRQCLDVLARMLRDSWFETSTRQVGLEVEVNLVDDSGTASMRSPDVLDAMGTRPGPRSSAGSTSRSTSRPGRSAVMPWTSWRRNSWPA